MSTQKLIDVAGGMYVPTMTVVGSDGAAISNTYKHVNTVATTLVKSGTGNLNNISINSKGTVASTVTVYDSLSATGTVVAIIDSLNISGTFTFDVAFTVGLTVVTTGTVAPSVTVSYR